MTTLLLRTVAFLATFGAAGALPTASAQQDPANGPAALGEQQVGQSFTIRAEDLPAPRATTVAASRSFTVPHQGQVPRVPDGFSATLFASGLEHPRRLLVLPNDDVVVAQQRVGYLTLLRAGEGGDRRAEWIEHHAEGFNAPYGLAWRDNTILVADQDGIWAVPHRLGGLRPGPAAVQRIQDVPPADRTPSPSVAGERMLTKRGVFGIVQGHQNRPLAIDPRSGALFVGVGSSGNIGVEPEVKASVQRFDADGSNQATFATGMRNPTALAFQPGTGDLYAVVQERDGLGDGLVPDFLVRVREGAFYGWPYAYIGRRPQPGFAQLRPDKVQASVAPDLLFESHSSVLDILFYDGAQFPAEYRGGAFATLHGSWNRSQPTGYKVVFVPFRDGRPEGSYRNFVTGFWTAGAQRAEVWGRPMALGVLKDGSLLVADDVGGTIWRIAYTGGNR